ncbi:MAG: DUF624 domain-containing protein [Prevotella sp.]|nr:DUF624 domain-containing protein [Staphylococcus sp.]MCM1350957.1 DUF624 domain-containing protein [Prevotella sp.]
MRLEENDKKYFSKTYRFFDLLYKLLVVNILTIILSMPIITIFPMLVACIATIRNDLNEGNIIKAYFRNVKQYFVKSFVLGICLLFILAIIIYAFFFWIFQEFHQSSMEWIAQAGFVVMIICLLIYLFSVVHIPYLIIILPKLRKVDIVKTSFYMAFRYIFTTIAMVITFCIIVGLLLICVAIPGLLAVWMIIGISLPIFLITKMTKPIYYQFERVDFDKIARQIEEELEDE